MTVLNHIPPSRVVRKEADLSDGIGLAIIILGRGGDLPTDYAFHPQVKPIDGSKLSPRQIDLQMPVHTRIVIFGTGEKLRRDVFTSIHDVLKRRQLPYLLRESDEAVRASLADLLPEKPKQTSTVQAKPEPPAVVEAKKIAARGTVMALITEHAAALLAEDSQMPAAEMARRLFRIAQDKGVPTTVQSLQQQVRQWKRTAGVGERPASAQTPERRVLSAMDTAIESAEELLRNLKAIRADYASKEKEVSTLSAQLEKAREVFNTFRSDVFTDEK
jgi:hypothetical protein